MVVESLQLLAASPTEQIEYVRSGGFHHDELALELDDVLGAFLGNCEPSKSAGPALGALDRQLHKMSGTSNARLWTDQALIEGEEWITVRRLATRSLTELHEAPSSPADPLHRGTRPAITTSRDEAVYGLVLRHMVEVGHGWGREPSPLQGFYVLNRVIDDVEDPSFNHETFEDAHSGLPFSHELMQFLATSLKAVSDIEFVPMLLELVDPESTQPIQVKNSRGFVALGPIRESKRHLVVGTYFYAGGRWSRSNRYELLERDGSWAITKFQNLMVS
jgi:hypothetical protein